MEFLGGLRGLRSLSESFEMPFHLKIEHGYHTDTYCARTFVVHFNLALTLKWLLLYLVNSSWATMISKKLVLDLCICECVQINH